MAVATTNVFLEDAAFGVIFTSYNRTVMSTANSLIAELNATGRCREVSREKITRRLNKQIVARLMKATDRIAAVAQIILSPVA